MAHDLPTLRLVRIGLKRSMLADLTVRTELSDGSRDYLSALARVPEERKVADDE